MDRVRRLKPRRVALAVLALAAAIVALLATAAAAPGSATGALVAGACGMAVAALVFSVWEWSFHRYLYHRDRGGLLRPLFLTHHRDHHFVYFPPWRLTSDTWDDGSAGAHPSVWTPVASTLVGRHVTVSDRLVYLALGAGLIGGGGAFATGHWAFLWGICAAGVAITLTFTRVHAAIHHPGSHPRLERLPGFPFLARHHYLHHLDTEANANFLLPLADWLFGTLRRPEPGADLFAAGRAMAPRAGLVLVLGALLLTPVAGCGGGSLPASASPASSSSSPQARARSLCTGQALIVDAAPGEAQTRGCLVSFVQNVADPAYEARFGARTVPRRYVLYVPANLPSTPAPVVFVFPGYGGSAETAAVHYTHTRFESLADQHGFVVVYGNGLPYPPDGGAGEAPQPEGGYFQGCFLEHSGEGIDVRYVREILGQLGSVLSVDRTRVYAAGLSAGGGLAFQLALEAPGLVAAIAPVAALPFQPGGEWLMHCKPVAGYGGVSIAMLAATADPFIAYEPGPSRRYPDARYPGMERTRDAWLGALGISGPPSTEVLPDRVPGDSYEPHSGLTSSSVSRSTYPRGPAGQELVFYRAVGAGHWWPHPTQIWTGLWATFGKTNQDVDFADEAWTFFQRHSK